MHDRLEKIKKTFHSYLPHPKHVKDGWAHRFFGSTLFQKGLWSFKGEALARGLALGLFVAFTPTIGFQMLIVCALILVFPGNLPIALAACWVTNVFTAPPIYFVEYKLGLWMLELFRAAPAEMLEDYPKFSRVYGMAGAMWLGSLVVGLAVGAAGYFFTLGVVAVERKLRLSKLTYHRRKTFITRTDQAKGADNGVNGRTSGKTGEGSSRLRS